MSQRIKQLLKRTTLNAACAVALCFATTGANAAVEHYSLDFNPIASGGTHGPSVHQVGPEPIFNLGNVWNDITFDGHASSVPPPATPIPLVDTSGAPSSATFTWGGSISGWANAPATSPGDVNDDYIFVNAGSADPSATWSVGGLTPGKQYDAYFYAGNSTGSYNLDMNGDGIFDNLVTAPVRGGVAVQRITANASGQINGDIGTTSAVEQTLSGIQIVEHVNAYPDNTLWSVDMQGVGGIIANPTPTTMAGVEAGAGLGDIWNAFNIPGHTGTSTNQSLNLADSNGNASSVTFSVNGTISSWSNTGNPLFNDYMFVNVGNADPSVTWKIGGLTPGGYYDLTLYGAQARGTQMNIDTDGDSTLESVVGVPVAAGVTLNQIVADANGSINGDFGTYAVAEENWAGFQLLAVEGPPPPADPNTLYSVDIQGVPSESGTCCGQSVPPILMNGVESNYQQGGVWNEYAVNGFNNLNSIALPSGPVNLVDSYGNSSNINFQILGDNQGWGGAGGFGADLDLIRDYAFVDAGGVAGVLSMDWYIDGLDPNGTYELYMYGGVARDMLMTIDLNGDQVLDEAGVVVDGNGYLFIVTPDATGKIIGRFANGTGDPEGNWSGFQLRNITVIPEPGTFALLALAGALITRRRKLA